MDVNTFSTDLQNSGISQKQQTTLINMFNHMESNGHDPLAQDFGNQELNYIAQYGTMEANLTCTGANGVTVNISITDATAAQDAEQAINDELDASSAIQNGDLTTASSDQTAADALAAAAAAVTGATTSAISASSTASTATDSMVSDAQSAAATQSADAAAQTTADSSASDFSTFLQNSGISSIQQNTLNNMVSNMDATGDYSLAQDFISQEEAYITQNGSMEASLTATGDNGSVAINVTDATAAQDAQSGTALAQAASQALEFGDINTADTDASSAAQLAASAAATPGAASSAINSAQDASNTINQEIAAASTRDGFAQSLSASGINTLQQNTLLKIYDHLTSNGYSQAATSFAAQENAYIQANGTMGDQFNYSGSNDAGQTKSISITIDQSQTVQYASV